jgi:hypothetical protein
VPPDPPEPPDEVVDFSELEQPATPARPPPRARPVTPRKLRLLSCPGLLVCAESVICSLRR